MSTLQQYLGQLAIDSTLKDFTIDDGGGADAVALTEGNYYIVGYSGESTAQLCEHMTAKINAVAGYGSAAVTYSASTGKITIAFGTATNVEIAWTDANLQGYLGFAGTQSGAKSYTGTLSPKWCWRPSLGLASYPGDLTQWWLPRSTSRYAMSPDGSTYGFEGTEIFEGTFGYRLLPVAEVIGSSTDPFNCFQRLWRDVVHKGRPIRCYPDRTLNASTSYYTAMMFPPDFDGESASLGSIGDLSRYYDSYNGLWSVEFKLCKHVTAT